MSLKKNGLLLVVSALSLGGITAAGIMTSKSEAANQVKAADSEAFSVTFKDNGTSGDGSTAFTTSTTVNTFVSSGASNITGITNVSATYLGKTGYGLKFGSNSGLGSITLGIASESACKPSKIVIETCRYGSDTKNVVVSAGGKSFTVEPTTTLASYTIDTSTITSAIDNITFASSAASKGRFYLTKFTVYTEAVTPVVTGVTLSPNTDASLGVGASKTYTVDIEGTNLTGNEEATIVYSESGAGDPSCTLSKTKAKDGETFDITAVTANGSGELYAEVGTVKSSVVNVTTTAAKTLSSIAISGTGKNSYYVGDTFDPTGLTVTATYEDASTADVTSSVTWSPMSFDAESIDKVTASYTEGAVTKTADYSVTVAQDVVTSVSVETTNAKASYAKGDAWVAAETGVTGRASYASGRTADLTAADFTYTGYDLSKAGTQTVTVSYQGTDYATYQIKVVADQKTAVIDTAKDGQITESAADKLVFAEDTVTMTLDKNTASTAANNYCPPTRTSTRAYNGTKVTFDAGLGRQIDSIVMTCAGDSYATVLKDNSTWTNMSSIKVGSSNNILEVTPTTESQTVSVVCGATTGWTKIEIVSSSNAKPVINISGVPENIAKGNTGTLTYETLNATNPVVTWSSSDSSKLEINSATGAFNAKGPGKVTVTANLACDEGEASATVEVIVNAGISIIPDIKAWGNALGDNETTEWTVTFSGFITNLNPNEAQAGKENSLTVSNHKTTSSGMDLMVYGVYSTSDLRKSAILDANLKIEANIQKYVKDSTTTIELVNPKVIAYNDNAELFAQNAFISLNVSCATGVDAVTAEQWNFVKGNFEVLDSYCQAKLSQVTPFDAYSEYVGKWAARYAKIVANRPDLDNFMNVDINSALNVGMNTIADGENAILIASVVAFGAALVGGYFLPRKKRA